jgi:uncharacterized protein (TIGR00369 family)
MLMDNIDQLRAMLPNTAAEALHIEILSVDKQCLVLRMPITNAARQPKGLLHGGISLLLAETAASLHSLFGLDSDTVTVLGVEINGSHLRPAADGAVRVEARPLRKSSTLIVHEANVIHEATEKLLCVARVTNFLKWN